MSESKKRKKSYYRRQAKKHCPNRRLLDAGLKGFLITCNRTEKQTVREAYNILNEYAFDLYGEELQSRSEETDDAEVDFDKAIADQVESLQGKDKVSERRFQEVDTKTTNCIFIKTSLERPDDLVTRIFEDVSETGRAKSRNILKIFPVLGTCRATEDKIEKLVTDLVASRHADEPLLTYAVLYKVRNNNLSRDVILPMVGRALHEALPFAKVDLTNPDVSISIDVLNKFACVSILKNFYKWKKYNLSQMTEPVKSRDGGQKQLTTDSDMLPIPEIINVDKVT